jgi:hypothetical protein
MKRETFILAIEAIEKQYNHDVDFANKLAEAFTEARSANLLPKNHFLTNALMLILQQEMNDEEICKYKQNWIEWFCYETNFGKDHLRLPAYNKDKTVIPLSNAGELYDFLVKEYSKKHK